ncbi:MAG TPA: EAL domain-containing protein, partial [Polyangiaceae bacterium]|nr:EAL domain-containing protein [Polyangiaceae bacterium]
MAVAVLLGAFILHVVAATTAVRLALRSRRLWWSAVALAIVLMALWRVTAAYDAAMMHTEPDLGTEVLAAVISVLTIVGMREAVRATAALRRSNIALRRSEDRYRAVADSAMDAIVVVDGKGRVMYANPTVESLFGYSPGDLFERPFALLAPDAEQLFARTTPVRGASRERVLQIRGRHKDGRTLSLEATFGEQEEDGSIMHTGILRDITQREELEQQLRTSEERYSLASRGANDGIWDWDLATDRIFFSPRWKSIVGLPENAPCASPADWMGRIHPDDLEGVRARLTAHLDGQGEHFEAEYRILHADGLYRWVLCRGIAVRTATGRAYRMAGSQTDITARKNAEERLLHEALHDGLTGLPNRAMLIDRLRRCLVQCRRRGGPPCAVLFVDLDRFKNVNDSLGHAVGDRLLIEVARKLTLGVRPEDTVARLGGDEFAILLERLENRQAGIDIVNRLLESLSERVEVEGHELVTTASIGFVWGDGRYENPEDLLRDADAAMYRAKELGKARCEIFDARMHDLACSRLALEAELRRAVQRDAIEVAYQPIVSLTTGRTCGFEALARWKLDGRMISPAEFIPIAEEAALIAPIELRIMRQALADLSVMQRNCRSEVPLTMNLNLSGRHLRDPMLVERLKDSLAAASVAPGSVRLEITESFLLEDDAHTAGILERLRGLGFKLVIDDFGTGYSSLAYLHRLPIECVKLDRSFVKEMESSERRATIVSAVVNLAKQLQLQTVAEGVETSAQVERLRRMGCDFVQGYFFSPAVDAKTAEA